MRILRISMYTYATKYIVLWNVCIWQLLRCWLEGNVGVWWIWPRWLIHRALDRHLVEGLGPSPWCKFPVSKFGRPSIEIHFKFSHFLGSIGCSGKIFQGPHQNFKGTWPMVWAPESPDTYVMKYSVLIKNPGLKITKLVSLPEGIMLWPGRIIMGDAVDAWRWRSSKFFLSTQQL